MTVANIEINLASLKNLALWARIVFSSLFVASLCAALICAYLGESNNIVIAVSLLAGTTHGIYSAEKIRKGIGFSRYSQQVETLHRDR
ncbi:hypothetical protein RGQ13_05165 [Thalassotalea psychrophila]|uniref:DUF202 domain-containing protein n=1 Tax=Thalassotalea psychrophila TaxID=3065647 RepID=A0ABY9U1I1_9GAMM|nr:hypothetical protein RGQ13_05165 [Colwelliaceae bacterium SQ149]